MVHGTMVQWYIGTRMPPIVACGANSISNVNVKMRGMKRKQNRIQIRLHYFLFGE